VTAYDTSEQRCLRSTESSVTDRAVILINRREIPVLEGLMLLLRNADFIVTMDAQRRIMRHASVVVDDTRILDIGNSGDIDRNYGARIALEHIIDCRGGLITPGFINTHAHTFEHLSRGLIPDYLETKPWALQYFFPFQAVLSEEEAYISAKMACLDMLRCGTTCFIDSSILIANRYVDAVVQAIDDFSMRAVLGRGFCDRVSVDLPSDFRQEWRNVVFTDSTTALREAEALLKQWTVRSGGRIRAWATIFGLFSLCTDDLFRGIKQLADRYSVGTNFHIASSMGEALELEARASVWPITQLDRLGALGPNVLLTHVVAIKDSELDLLAKTGTKVAHCPGAALRLAKGVSKIGKIPEMLARGIPVSLGADGVCSSGTFDHTRLMFLAAGLFKDARMNASMIPAETALEMATINGAKGLLWDTEIGSIEVGKAADLILFDVRRAEWIPAHDIVRNLVYSSDGSSITHVIVNGRIVMHERKPVNVDETKLLHQAQEAGERIARRAGLDPQSKWRAV
jgi:cytosine/adenosine deaminase-related metal-dependent hydrolase